MEENEGKPRILDRSHAAPIHVTGGNNLILNVGHDLHNLTVHQHPEKKSRPRKYRISWRDELIGLIVDRGAEIEMSAGDLVQLAMARLRPIEDLAELTVDELGSLYDLLSKLTRPALE